MTDFIITMEVPVRVTLNVENLSKNQERTVAAKVSEEMRAKGFGGAAYKGIRPAHKIEEIIIHAPGEEAVPSRDKSEEITLLAGRVREEMARKNIFGSDADVIKKYLSDFLFQYQQKLDGEDNYAEEFLKKLIDSLAGYGLKELAGEWVRTLRDFHHLTISLEGTG
ncbi:MAG: hypothetical protein GY847_20165 [Proteobacteria bacterium]|nr:hypothetical protein [Pseudomonadota bacterium]